MKLYEGNTSITSMTYGEVIEKYRELFIMLVEKAGRETGNTSYLGVESLLTGNKCTGIIENLVSDEADFQVVVCSFIVALFCDIYGPEKIEQEWDAEKSYEKLTEFYQLYLRRGTIRFCQRYGLPEFDDPDTSFKLITLRRNGKAN